MQNTNKMEMRDEYLINFKYVFSRNSNLVPGIS